VKHVQPRATHKVKPTLTGHAVGGVSIIVDIGTAESHTETQVTPTKPIHVTPLPTHPSGHAKPKPKSKPTKPVKPVTPPTPQPPAPPVATPTPPVATPTPPVPTPPSTPPVVSQTQPTPPVVGTPSPPVVNGPDDTSSDTRPGNGWGDKNHTHTGPPGQNKKSGG
jgi:hypothetical protein